MFLLTNAYGVGHVEPCAKWESFPVKICKGSIELFAKYTQSLNQDHKSVRRFGREFNKEFSKTEVVESNHHYPAQDDLWKVAKETIKEEFTTDRTGIYFEFLETEDLTQCDSVLFFASSLNSYEGFSTIGDRADKKNKTNVNRKTPSATFIKVGFNESEFSTNKVTKENFTFEFKNTLIHEIGHLAGLLHTHNYVKEYDKFFGIKEAFKESNTSVDACGMDPYSIMSYHFLDWIEDTENVVMNTPFPPPQSRTLPAFEQSRLSSNDMKSLRCLYGTEPGCIIECKDNINAKKK